MTSQPKVSVIIPCKNGGSYLAQQLDHLCNQVQAPSFEVIISDNGSTDGSPQQAAQDFSHKLNIRVVDSSATSGISYARNQGALAAQGSYLLFCDADDYVDEHWISEIYAAFQEENADIVGGKLTHTTVNSPEVLEAYGITGSTALSTDRFTQCTELIPFSGYKPSVAGCNFAVARQFYLNIGGMDLSYIGGSEETDFTWRVLDAGGKLVSANKALVSYRLRTTFKGIFKQQYNYQRTKVLLWTRFHQKGMSGQSVKYSVVSIVKALPLLASRKNRLSASTVIGGNLGALHGILVYRILKRVPSRHLLDSSQ